MTDLMLIAKGEEQGMQARLTFCLLPVNHTTFSLFQTEKRFGGTAKVMTWKTKHAWEPLRHRLRKYPVQGEQPQRNYETACKVMTEISRSDRAREVCATNTRFRGSIV